jgi:hypothetical protein
MGANLPLKLLINSILWLLSCRECAKYCVYLYKIWKIWIFWIDLSPSLHKSVIIFSHSFFPVNICSLIELSFTGYCVPWGNCLQRRWQLWISTTQSLFCSPVFIIFFFSVNIHSLFELSFTGLRTVRPLFTAPMTAMILGHIMFCYVPQVTTLVLIKVEFT